MHKRATGDNNAPKPATADEPADRLARGVTEASSLSLGDPVVEVQCKK